MRTDPSAEVKSWAQREIERCVDPQVNSADFFHSINDELPHVYIIDIFDRCPTLRLKRYEINVFRARALVYLHYMQSILLQNNMKSNFSIAIDIEDLAKDESRHPVFSFQRMIGSSNILLPDIDTLTNDFYLSPKWGLPDTIPYRKKRDLAIFAGSTTGADPIRAIDLERPFPRLRAARHFRDAQRVEFALTSIVQAATPAVEVLLRKEGLGSGSIPWKDQLRCKLLLSMDGNGAALSRPFIALASNCAMIKYSSVYEAYYFQHLQPGEHFLAVETDEEVLDLVEGDLDRHEPIARASTRFSETYLSRAMHEVYTIELLRAYASRFSQKSRTSMIERKESLEEIGCRLGTDKSRIEHDFLGFYEEQLRTFEGRQMTLYEIGVFRGASLRTWAAWFDKATVVGLDIDPGVADLQKPPNAHIRIGDAGSVEFLQSVVSEFGEPTVVIDDGSHRWHHQMIALQFFWPRIAAGGCFIMEDIHTSFPALAVEYRGLGVMSAYDYLVHLQRWVVGNRFMASERPFDDWIERHWNSVASIHWMRGTAIIKKR